MGKLNNYCIFALGNRCVHQPLGSHYYLRARFFARCCRKGKKLTYC